MFKRTPGCSRRCRLMLQKNMGNVIKDSGKLSRRFRGMYKKIPENIVKDSGEYSRSFRGLFEKIPGSVIKDSGEWSRRFREMFLKILRNVPEDTEESKFWFTSCNLACLSSNLLLNYYKTIINNNCRAILLKKTFSAVLLITNILSLITLPFLFFSFFFILG